VSEFVSNGICDSDDGVESAYKMCRWCQFGSRWYRHHKGFIL